MTYDPNIGRWLEEDPIGLDAGDVNLYRFVGDNPTNEVDPSGLEGFYSDGGYLKWKRDQELAKWFYKTPDAGTRNNYKGSQVMSIFGISKYTSIWPWASITEDYNKFTKGCIGLLYLRLNSPDNGTPWTLPGSKGFTNLDSALEEQKNRMKDLKEDEVVVLYAIQPSSDKLRKEAVRPGGNEYDLSKVNTYALGSFNFATAAQAADGTVRFWEWMGGGESAGENPELTVKHGAELPPDDGHGNRYQEENAIYMVVTIKKHDRAMPTVK